MAERRVKNLHEALQKYQLEVAWYKSAYEKEKREKDRLLGADFQQVFPSTITGGFEVTRAPQAEVRCIPSCFFEFILSCFYSRPFPICTYFPGLGCSKAD